MHGFYADEFAGAFLLPEGDFLLMQQEGRSLIDMAVRFGVSLTVACSEARVLKEDNYDSKCE